MERSNRFTIPTQNSYGLETTNRYKMLHEQPETKADKKAQKQAAKVKEKPIKAIAKTIAKPSRAEQIRTNIKTKSLKNESSKINTQEKKINSGGKTPKKSQKNRA